MNEPTDGRKNHNFAIYGWIFKLGVSVHVILKLHGTRVVPHTSL